MIPAPLSISVPPPSRMSVDLIFDGRADDARVAAVSAALAAWLTGDGPLTLPDDVRLASIPLPVAAP
jgi:hypothetical protein